MLGASYYPYKTAESHTILKVFFGVNKPLNDFEKIRELTIKMRKGLF